MKQSKPKTRVERLLGAPLANNAVRRWPLSGGILRAKARIAEVESHFQNLKLDVTRRHTCGDVIVVEWNTDYGDGRVPRNVSSCASVSKKMAAEQRVAKTVKLDQGVLLKRCHARCKMKYWELISDKLSASGWNWGCISAIDSNGRTIWIADAHRGDGDRSVVRVTSSRRDRTFFEAASQTAIAVRPGTGEEARSHLCQLCNAISGIDSR